MAAGRAVFGAAALVPVSGSALIAADSTIALLLVANAVLALLRNGDRFAAQFPRLRARAEEQPAPEVDGLATVSPMPDTWLSDTRSSYDTEASGYAEKVRGLLGERPYLRASLALFAELVHGAGGGPVADVGCGPGYVTGHLNDLGVDAFGIDISPEMIAIARRDYPGLRFEVGTMTALDLADDSVAGVLAFWSVIHVPDHAVPGVFEQFHRVLRPGGPLLVGFHVGDETRRTSEGYTGRPINVDSHHRRPSTIAGWLRDAGFTIEAELVIGPDDGPGAVIFARSHT